MISLGMDGPNYLSWIFLKIAQLVFNTNWAILRKIQDKRGDKGFSILEDIGSCGLHIVCGALQSGVKESSWLLKKSLQLMCKLFHNFPARKDVYIQIN